MSQRGSYGPTTLKVAAFVKDNPGCNGHVVLAYLSNDYDYTQLQVTQLLQGARRRGLIENRRGRGRGAKWYSTSHPQPEPKEKTHIPIEDKLTHDERIRLECLAQANITASRQSAEIIVDIAKKYETFVIGKKED